MNFFEQIKEKYKLNTNLKGIEYINALETELLFLQKVNLIATHLMTDKQLDKLSKLVDKKYDENDII